MPEPVIALASGYTTAVQVTAEQKEQIVEWAETVWPRENYGIPITVEPVAR